MPKLMLFVVILFITAGCGDVSYEKTIKKGGLVFKIGDSKPYTGTVTGYARKGSPSRKMKYEKRYKNGIRHGDTKFWYANGKLECVEPYTNGKLNGVIIQYYESGQLKARFHMVDGRRGGTKGEQFWHEGEIETKDFSKRFFK